MSFPIARRRFVQSALGAAAAAGKLRAQSAWKSQWQGSRVWIGPEYWANPLQGWRVEDGEVVARSGGGRNLHLLSAQIDGRAFETSVTVRLHRWGSNPEEAWAGFQLAVQGDLPGYRHALVHPTRSFAAGVRGDGRLFVEDAVSEKAVPLTAPLELRLKADEAGVLELAAGGVRVSQRLDPADLRGNLALAAQAPAPRVAEPTGTEWGFRDWTVAGLEQKPEQSFGPILWSQYTLSRGTLKLLAHFPPLGHEDADVARLEIRDGDAWTPAAEASIDPLSRTALFRLDDWDDANDVAYRVVYDWQGAAYEWSGRVRRDPREQSELQVAALSCDHGECFPQERLVRNLRIQDPDLLFFAGDQIYESHGGFGVARDRPTPEAMLDYLRKYWQHGWTWRDLLKDRPSIVIPDDHDVFQGNIWGQAGRPLPPSDGPRPRFENGGFLMPVDWVNAVQRTQAGHLPDPVDPDPLDSGIEVYFTEIRYGGASIAVLEDRKFKTGPGDILTPEQRAAADEDPAAVDVPGAELLGARQEDFLRAWAQESADADFRLVCSQTIFCKATTHSGRDLVRRVVDLDCGGWPQSARNRALAILQAAPDVIMLHGDQHIGSLVRQGVEEWEDGPVAFMVPGTSNGFPRAWRPESPGENRDPGAPPWSGRYVDGLGNRMTVLGAANPEPGSNTREGQAGLDPEEVAHRKGSGHGIVRLDRSERRATFEMWRHAFDAARPGDADQFEGFPVRLELPQPEDEAD